MPKCNYPNCVAHAIWGFPRQASSRCTRHKLEGQMPYSYSYCTFPQCERTASYANPGSKNRIFCAAHAPPGTVNLRPHCAHPECSRTPCFNFPPNRRGLYCAAHKLLGMVNVKKAKCCFPACPHRPCFNFPGLGAKFCRQHKDTTMINVTKRPCAHPGCPIIPSFNVPGNLRGKYCLAHKEPGMVSINPTCEIAGCGVRATRFVGALPARHCYCVPHAPPSSSITRNPE